MRTDKFESHIYEDLTIKNCLLHQNFKSFEGGEKFPPPPPYRNRVNVQSRQINLRETYCHAPQSLCFFANLCLDCGWILRAHSFTNMLSAHNHMFHIWGITVCLNINDLYPQQNPKGCMHFLCVLLCANQTCERDGNQKRKETGRESKREWKK